MLEDVVKRLTSLTVELEYRVGEREAQQVNLRRGVCDIIIINKFPPGVNDKASSYMFFIKL